MKKFALLTPVLLAIACANGPQLRQPSDNDRDEAAGAPFRDSPSYNSPYRDSGAPGAIDRNPSTQRLESAVQPKKKLVVFAFWNNTPVGDETLGAQAADELSELLSAENVIIADGPRNPLKTIDYIQGDRIKMAQLIQEGKRLGVSLIAIGKIAKVTLRQDADPVGLLRKKYSWAAADLEVKLYDVQSGREILASAKSGQVSDRTLAIFEGRNLDDASYRMQLTGEAVRQALQEAVPDIVRSFGKTLWQGRIAKISGSKFFISAGRASGLTMGDILKVVGLGEDIFDPVTGAFIGHSSGQQKGTLEIVDFIGHDGGVAHVHAGGNFQEGDIVQLY